MSRQNKLFKNTIIYSIGNFSSKLIAFIMLPLYTKYLSLADYGYYDIVLTTISLILPIVALQIPESMYRFILGKENDENSIISTSYKVLLKNLILFNILYLVVAHFIGFRFSNLILIQINSLVVSKFFLYIARAKKKIKLYSLSSFVSSAIIVISNLALLILFDAGVKALILSNILANTGIVFFLESKLRVSKLLKLRNAKKEITKDLLRFSLPLIPTSIIWWVMNVSDRYLIVYYLGESSNGIYAIANKIPSIIIILYGFYNLAWQDSAIEEIGSKDQSEYFSERFNNVLTFLTTFSIVIIAFSNIIFSVLVNSKFHEAINFVPMLLLATLFYCFSAFYGVGFRTSKETKGELYSSIAGALVNITLNVIFIPKYGVIAAAMSTLISFIVVWGYRIFLTRKYYRIEINYTRIGVLTLFLVISTVLSKSNHTGLEIANITLSMIVFFLLNNKLILEINNHLKLFKRR
ncbi:oligosaccharide flippase family protein [uncultured Ilyobacter sp.]|uniref:lipopolysaccharide biosynthesis protein n=1 Tax=uncultured Ilyobacter sp. TaxID=544433 RepID=UPI002AA6372F|nr:oligosaccharide flippase family protein [uncultured Ilyobacter sp.]